MVFEVWYSLGLFLGGIAAGIFIAELLSKAAEEPDDMGIEPADLCPNCDTLLTLSCHRCGYIRRGEIPFAEVE